MSKLRAPKIRTELHAILSNLPSSGLETSDIVATLRREHPELIEEEFADVTDIGLTKLAVDVSRWASGAVDTTQPAFSEEFNIPKILTLRVAVDGKVKKINKKLEDFSLLDGKTYIEQHDRRKEQSHDLYEISRLVKFVEASGAAPTANLVKSWAEAKAAGK